ncbi:MAG TPA: hypothetical protein VFJ05_04935 [Nitrososphaeraceae archaeon]|nr:hypothetical protein [Nitrososphaeraceae archaeon]
MPSLIKMSTFSRLYNSVMMIFGVASTATRRKTLNAEVTVLNLGTYF